MYQTPIVFVRMLTCLKHIPKPLLALSFLALGIVGCTTGTASPTRTLMPTPKATSVGFAQDKQLKIGTFDLNSPSAVCAADSVKNNCQCLAGEITCKQCQFTVNQSYALPQFNQYYQTGQPVTVYKCPEPWGIIGGRYMPPIPDDAQCVDFCFGKPVIYLYPTEPILASVTVTVPGIITESIPKYPKAGWQDILALPSGKLFYQGKAYTELYYESQVAAYDKPTNGIIIPTAQLRPTLQGLVTQLVLTKPEVEEFLAYWLPKLQALHKQYVLFSVLLPAAKEAVDMVHVTPKPQTRIEFLVYFKGLDEPLEIPRLQLPKRPQRHGFTMVEWGGTIDY